jgi:hypothetical protein
MKPLTALSAQVTGGDHFSKQRARPVLWITKTVVQNVHY